MKNQFLSRKQQILLLYENNPDELKKNLKNFTIKDRQILINIINIKKIYNIILKNPEEKFKILLKVYKKYKDKIICIFFLRNILKLSKNDIKKLEKEYFNLLPIEEQNKIKESKKNSYLKRKENYNNLSIEEKKIINKNKKKIYIKKHGYKKYRFKCNEAYKKWYKNRNENIIKENQEKRKLRWINLSQDIKEKYKKNRVEKISNMTVEEKNIYYQNQNDRKKIFINSLSPKEKENYLNKLKLEKQIYFSNISLEKKKVINEIRKYQRQLAKNKITNEEYKVIKKIILDENKKYL